MSPDQPMRIAIVGAGRFANIAASAWERLPDIRVAAVADTLPEAAGVLAARLEADVVSAEEAVGGAVADIAYIATPPWLQPEYASAALQAGMHVICEKPMALRASDIRHLAATARRAHRVVTPDFMQRHGPLANGVRRVIEHFENYATDQELPDEHWFWDRRKSGGIFVEHAVHFFDLFRWWLGEARVLSSFVVPRGLDANGIHDQVHCTSAHGTVLVEQYHGFHQAGRLDRQRLGIVFERGDIALEGWIPTSATIRGIADEATLRELEHIFDGAQVACTPVPPGTIGRGRPLDGAYDFTIATGQADKPSLYVDMLEARFRDAVTAMRDTEHVQRVTVADAEAALMLAESATQLARIIGVPNT
jgi:predicted dehydrogenase